MEKDIKKNTEEMAWNEPGGGSGDKDPWGSQGGNQSPPDLDEVVRKLQQKLSGLFGGGKTGQGGSGGGTAKPGTTGISWIILIIAALWGLSGLYIVDEGTRGVVLRFGQYAETTQAGLHWHIPYPVENVTIINVESINNVEIGYRSGSDGAVTSSVPREALMLTQDENIIDTKFAIQYKIKDAKDYLFNVKDADPEFTQARVLVRQATESAVRDVIGKSKMDFALKEGRAEVALQTEALVQKILDRYQSGLQIISVNMQDAQPPEQVQHAFNDAIKAGQDQDRLKNEGEAYANDILPKARGAAARLLEEAEAYRNQVIAQAEGDASRFKQVLTEYKKAPRVTRERLYLDAIEEVMKNSTKVMVDVKGGNNLLYLPLDRMMQGAGALMPEVAATTLPQTETSTTNNSRSSSTSSVSQRLRDSVRLREVR